MSQSEKLKDNQIFGRYQIVRTLGEGGMGAVYEAVHLGLKKRFAIKTLLPSIAQSPEAQSRFLREGEAASRMNHPNVVDVTDVGTEGGIPYLVMEYLEGETLGDFVARQGQLDVSLAVDLILPAVSAVAAGHQQGVIHRDLKPQNIFLARGAWGELIPKILDFGVSKMIGGENPALTGTMAVLGTASYMSPEQARGARVVDAKSDQYAMGLIFFEMLTGRRAHDGEHPLEVLHKIASGTILDPRRLRPDLPDEVEAILMRMLANQPDERYPSLSAVGSALLPFASDKMRMNFATAFVGAGTAGVGALAGGTLLLPDAASRPKSGGTKLLPPSARQITTLGQSAVETHPGGRARSSGRGKAVVAVAVVAAAIAVVAVFLRGRHEPETSQSASETQPVVAPPAARPIEPIPAPAEEPAEAAPPRPSVRAAPAVQEEAGSSPPPRKHHPHPAAERLKPAEKHPPQGANGSPIID